MKRKINKLIMIVVASIMFVGTLFLCLKKNDKGNWEFTSNAFAQGGDELVICPDHNWLFLGYTGLHYEGTPYLIWDSWECEYIECVERTHRFICHVTGIECGICDSESVSHGCGAPFRCPGDGRCPTIPDPCWRP